MRGATMTRRVTDLISVWHRRRAEENVQKFALTLAYL